MLLDIRPDHLQIVQTILQKHVPQYAVWAFGSRAKWTAKDYSDLDLCIVSDKPLSFSLLGAIAEDFSDSDLPWKVDVVDWATTSEGFRKIIERDKVVLQKPGMGKSAEWRSITFGEFVALQRGHDLPDQDRRTGAVPILGSFGITGFHDTKKANGPGVTIGRSGASFGVAAYTNKDYWPLNTALYVTDFKGNDPKFVYYFLRDFDFSGYNSGSAQPSLNRNNLYGIPVRIPPPLIQKQIAQFVSALDDRITLLRETNATLEAIAQALFKSWFVDFDPVHAKQQGRAPEGMDEATAALFPDSFEESELGLAPKGWRVGNVADLGEVICGKTPPTSNPQNYGDDVPFITIPDMHGHLVVTATNRALSRLGADSQRKKYLPPGAICVSCIATPGLVVRVTTESQTNQQINSVVPLASWGKSFPLFLLRRIGDAVRAGGSGGSVFHNLSKSGFEELKVLLTSAAIAQKFDEIIEPLVVRIEANQRQAQALATLRDTLLPRLISGQLRLPEAEAMIEHV